jgi:hypothetical protein
MSHARARGIAARTDPVQSRNGAFFLAIAPGAIGVHRQKAGGPPCLPHGPVPTNPRLPACLPAYLPPTAATLPSVRQRCRHPDVEGLVDER